MAFNIGLMVIRRMCEQQLPRDWHKAKLSTALFKGTEIEVFKWVDAHVSKHHALPQVVTLEAAFPDIKEISTPEPSSYYLSMLENKFYYETLNNANIDSQSLLKENQNANVQAAERLQEALNVITQQKYRAQIVDVGLEAAQLVLKEYHSALSTDDVSSFGWDYLDKNGNVMPGEVVSIVGRPGLGKTWLGLYGAIHNWKCKRNVLFVSMEMSPLAVLQRVSTMYAGTNIGQLKLGAYATSPKGASTYDKFKAGLQGIYSEDAKFYLIDGNLAASAEDVYTLADQLKCKTVYVDGAYLLRHRNGRLNRFERVAENVELIKRFTTDQQCCSFTSWQFNREASKKKGKNEEAGLEDIAFADGIGQISSIVLGLFQQEGIETVKRRQIRILKGRNGEIGSFEINWDFTTMSFSEAKDEGIGPLPFV
jgi:replicative DNA helicase